MITHLNYIEDKELRDYIYDELNEIKKEFSYIAVDDETWNSNQSKIYAYKMLPYKNDFMWAGTVSQQLFYDTKYLTSSPSVYDVFNTTRDRFDIEKILNNWKEDQRDNNANDNSEDILNKILNNFGLKINSVFQNRNNNKFFRINKHADIEEYINNGWRVTGLYEFIDIIDDMYDDDPMFKYNVEKQFEEFKNKEKYKKTLSDEIKRVIKSIIEINYSFIKIHPDENKISIHKSTKHKPLFIYTNKETIEWFLNFIKEDFINNDTDDIIEGWKNTSKKILYINKLKDYMKEIIKENYND